MSALYLLLTILLMFFLLFPEGFSHIPDICLVAVRARYLLYVILNGGIIDELFEFCIWFYWSVDIMFLHSSLHLPYLAISVIFFESTFCIVFFFFFILSQFCCFLGHHKDFLTFFSCFMVLGWLLFQCKFCFCFVCFFKQKFVKMQFSSSTTRKQQNTTLCRKKH